ncbi:MAG TPA: hypothetical protein DIT25_02275, partial [Candidatus Moranbacteria bacterium]|nr:hypothetical protein [Candidatus Moranbacteria bacterium]
IQEHQVPQVAEVVPIADPADVKIAQQNVPDGKDMEPEKVQIERESIETLEEATRKKKLVEGAGNFSELYSVLEEIGEVQGSSEIFSAAQLIQLIDLVREKTKDMSLEQFYEEMDDELFLKELPIKYGIKYKVGDLIREEKKAAVEKAGAEEIEKERRKREILENLDKARTVKIRKEMEAEKNLSSVSKVLWKTLRIGGLGEYDKERQEVEEAYQKALKDYLADFLGESLNEQTVGKAVRILNIDEHDNLKNARRMESEGKEGRTKKIWNSYMSFVEAYKNIGKDDKSKLLKFSKKALATAALIGGSIGVAAVGGAIAAPLGTGAAFLVRGFTISASSLGFKALYEKRAGAKLEKENQEETKRILRETKIEGTGPIKYELLKIHLDQKIADINSVILSREKSKRNRTIGAIATASGISVIGALASKEILDFLGLDKWINNRPDVEVGADNVSESVPAAEAGNEPAGPKHEAANTSNVPAPETSSGENFVQTAEKGDSVWKLAEKQLEERYQDKFSGLDDVKKTYIIDSIKDKIVENPESFGLTDPDKIAIGQRIDFSEIFQNKGGMEEILSRAESIGGKMAENISQAAEAANVEGIPEPAMSEPAGMQSEIPSDINLAGGAESALPNYGEKSLFEAEIAGVMAGFIAAKERSRKNVLLENRSYGNYKFFESFKKAIFEGKQAEAARLFQKTIEKYIGKKGAWKSMKNMTFWQAMEEGNWRSNKQLDNLFGNLKKVLGDEIRPQKGMTMEKWSKKVADIAIKQAGTKL